MKKLIRGILHFREARRQEYAKTFSKLALGQKPDALFIACSDSRVAVNVFASSDPGDLFVVRNIGNLVPPYHQPGATGTVAAVDFAVDHLNVRDIIICGHSDCGAIRARSQGLENLPDGGVKAWLQMGMAESVDGDLNEASRRNVIAQLGRLKQYPSVAKAIAERRLALHGMWFDIHNVDVLYYEDAARKWTVLESKDGERILNQLERP